MPSNYRDQKQLRAIGHSLKPIITVAQKGLSENIRTEIERALHDHELIKLKLVAPDREARQALNEEICREFAAICVQQVGHMILLYRAAAKPDPKLSNILRNKPRQ